MEIITRKLAEITPYEKNPRKNDGSVDKVAESIKEFGFKVPIVIDKNGVIVAGHTRYKAAKKLRLASVPVIVADDLNEDQVRAFRLADNKVGEGSEWDFNLLDEELGELLDFDMTAFGFDEIYTFTDDEDEPSEPQEELFGDVEQLEKHYGVPYQGNKSRIADIIVNILPAGERLVDLFGGGGRDYTLCHVEWQME